MKWKKKNFPLFGTSVDDDNHPQRRVLCQMLEWFEILRSILIVPNSAQNSGQRSVMQCYS